jgi:hypothetical protein
MKAIIAALVIAVAGPAQASDREVFSAILGAAIGYHIGVSQVPQPVHPQEVYVFVQQPDYRHQQHQYRNHQYQPQVIVVEQRGHVHPQLQRIYRDQCIVDGPGRHGHIICR